MAPARLRWQRPQVLLAVAIAAFVLSRVWLMTWPEVISDTLLYYELAMRSTYSNFVIYRDYAFAYPTLSWLIVKWPALLDPKLEFHDYRFYFRLQLCLLDVVTSLSFVYVWIRRTGDWIDPTKALLIYGALSLCMGDLLYDRIDLLMVFSMALLFASWNADSKLKLPKRNSIVASTAFILGFFTKLIPMGLWPFWFVEWFARFRSRALVFVLIPIVCVGGLFLLDRYYTPGMIQALGLHGVRGIQIESMWASPFILEKIAGWNDWVEVVSFMGADEITPAAMSDTYVTFARYTGFVVMAALLAAYTYFYIYVPFRRKRPIGAGDLSVRTNLFLLFIFCFLVFQRVLSTQFLIWATPFAGFYLARRWSWILFVPLAGMYGITYLFFGENYLKMLRFAVYPASLLLVRNVCVLLVFVKLVVDFCLMARERLRAGATGTNERERATKHQQRLSNFNQIPE